MNPHDDDDIEDEEAIALRAVEAWLDVEGDDELAQASREALSAIAQEALARKEARERREATERRAEAHRERERQAERERVEARERAERWEAERRARDARLAAVERAHARKQGERRVEAVPAPTGRREAVRRAWERPVLPARLVRKVEAPPVPVVEDEHDHREMGDDEQSNGAAEAGWETFEASPTIDPPEEPDRVLIDAAAPAPTGADLAAWRVRHGLTQQAAADRLGVRQGTVSKAESRGAGTLGPALREALAGVLAEERGAA
ncbi:MAG: helix-turn-helix transcriptional regulator [Alphaproteobacteria bacterium]|nr:helix-turn-helix transcriptional regulator [Alphaproteobacteria bacterium]